MNGLNINALNYFNKHINSAKTNEEIKLICTNLIRADKVRISKEYSDYLLNEKQRVFLKYKVPEYVENLPFFLIFLRQNFLKKIFSHNIISQEPSIITSSVKNIEMKENLYAEDMNFLSNSNKNSLVKKNTMLSENLNNKTFEEENNLVLNPCKSSILQKKNVEILLEKSDFSFLFNFFRELNGVSILREQIFGWCIFLLLVSLQ